MVHIDRELFDSKCKEIIRDVKKSEATSPTWIWMTMGAAIGFIASCIRIRKNDYKVNRKVGTGDGKYSYFRDC